MTTMTNQAEQGLYHEGVNVERLQRACTVFGLRTNGSLEAFVSPGVHADHVNRLTTAVIKHFLTRPAAPAPEGCTQGHPAHHSSEHTLSLPTQEDIDLAALVHLGYGPGELDAEMRRAAAARRAAHAVEGTANPQAQRITP